MRIKSLNLLTLLVVLFLSFASCTTDEAAKKTARASNDLPLGASANDFLSDENYTSLDVEIVYVTGFPPTSAAISQLEIFFEKYIYKPGGIFITTRAIPAPNLGTYSLEELKQLETKHRSIFTSENTLGAYIFFADNKSESAGINQIVIGKAYRNTSMVVFEKEVRGLAANSNISISEIQHTTMRHEFGHLFGLVDNGTEAQTDHEDPNPDYKAHCNVKGCLMAASIEFGGSPFDSVEGNNGFLDFKEKCQLDLKANGGK